jgi:hypothetical protein
MAAWLRAWRDTAPAPTPAPPAPAGGVGSDELVGVLASMALAAIEG